jgi:ferric-dicitrate binding protein FerR (iron transport regulator)
VSRRSRDPEGAPSRARSDGGGEAEQRLRRGAELVLEHEPLTGPAPLPDFAHLMSARSRRGWWRLSFGAVGLSSVAAVVVALWLRGLAPVSYIVDGEAAAVAGTRVAAPRAGEDARIRFSEGTEVMLVGPSAEVDVVQRTARGALLVLERGQARFSVVHRRGARWSVMAGPFAIEVTGTEFTVDWAPEAGRMALDLRVGSVRVRGASVGGAVELHAGEHLVATAADHRVTLSSGVERRRTGASAAEGGGGPSSPGTAAPGWAAEAPADGAGGGAHASLSSARGEPSRIVVGPSDPEPSAREPSAREPRAVGGRDLALWSPREGGRIELPEHRVPTLEGGRSAGTSRPPLVDGPRTDPAPAITPALPGIPQSLTLGGGGLFCVTIPAQYTFEQPAAGLSVPALFTTAFSSPRLDRSHSWCGESSVRVDAGFDDDGRQNYFGRFANETGQLLVKLEHPIDLTGRTVTMHVFVEGPWDARFSAELAVVDHGRWVSNAPSRGLTPGRWWTVTHHFGKENDSGVPGSSNPQPFPNGGRSTVSEVDRLALAIRSTGERRTWRGAVFVDDIAWK